mgnify:CR=1 FL=1
MKAFIYLAISIILVTPYFWNFVKLVDCDFEPDYKCEVIHGLGVIPPLSYITVWFDTDGENNANQANNYRAD